MAKGDGRDSRPLRNKHHIFFPKKIWLASGEDAVGLRYSPWCIVEVPVDLHEALHQ